MKKILSVILACCLISSCGGGESRKPPFKDGKVGAEVPVENLQKAEVPFISFTKTGTVVLGISAATILVAGILLISFLSIELVKANRKLSGIDTPAGEATVHSETAAPLTDKDEKRIVSEATETDVSLIDNLGTMRKWVRILRWRLRDCYKLLQKTNPSFRRDSSIEPLLNMHYRDFLRKAVFTADSSDGED
jgi:hypothetical protein